MMKKKILGILILVLVFIGIAFIDSNDSTTKVISYNGNNLRISVDGVSSNTLPTSGNYYLVDYTCKNNNTKVTWDKSTYKLNISNGTKKGEVACYLEFKSRPLLSEMEVGSYVAYIGASNGCDVTNEVNGYTSCSGKNANYVSDTDMGYCRNSTYKFLVNGWRIGYIENGSAYLISAGATDCMCTGSSGVSSNSSCSGSIDVFKHFNNMNNIALKYCNSAYSKEGVCDSSTVWAMNAVDFSKITGNTLSYSSCYNKYSAMNCGYTNDLIDNGGDYWVATSPSYRVTFYWSPLSRHVSDAGSTALHGVRPVLYLDSSIIVTGGEGTYENPYKIGGYGFYVNNGGTYISSYDDKSNVQLILSGVDVSTMCISVDTSVCTNYIPFSDSYSLDMSSYSEGEHVIYVYYKDVVGNLVASMNQSIILDTVAPTNNSIAISGGNTFDRTLTLSSTGADYMCFSNTSSNASDCTNWVEYATTYNWTLTSGYGVKTVYAFFKDEAGNIADVVSSTIEFFDTQAPTNNSIAISGGNTFDRTLTLSSTGADYMCFSNTSSNASDCTNWVEYATTYNWTLSSGYGSKTVYAFFKDESGNIAAVVSATVSVLDTSSLKYFLYLNENIIVLRSDGAIGSVGNNGTTWSNISGLDTTLNVCNTDALELGGFICIGNDNEVYVFEDGAWNKVSGLSSLFDVNNYSYSIFAYDDSLLVIRNDTKVLNFFGDTGWEDSGLSGSIATCIRSRADIDNPFVACLTANGYYFSMISEVNATSIYKLGNRTKENSWISIDSSNRVHIYETDGTYIYNTRFENGATTSTWYTSPVPGGGVYACNELMGDMSVCLSVDGYFYMKTIDGDEWLKSESKVY